LEWWSFGVVEQWSFGVVEYWGDGVLDFYKRSWRLGRRSEGEM